MISVWSMLGVLIFASFTMGSDDEIKFEDWEDNCDCGGS